MDFGDTLASAGFVQPLIYTIHDYDRIGLKSPYVSGYSSALSEESDNCRYVIQIANATGPDFSEMAEDEYQACYLVAAIAFCEYPLTA